MPWSVPNLQDALDIEENLANVPVKFSGTVKKYQCSCGSFVPSFRLVDCRSLPHVNQDFACDGCWTMWRRKNIDIDGNGADALPLAVLPEKAVEYFRPNWSKRWMKAHGAPKKILDKY